MLPFSPRASRRVGQRPHTADTGKDTLSSASWYFFYLAIRRACEQGAEVSRAARLSFSGPAGAASTACKPGATSLNKTDGISSACPRRGRVLGG